MNSYPERYLDLHALAHRDRPEPRPVAQIPDGVQGVVSAVGRFVRRPLPLRSTQR